MRKNEYSDGASQVLEILNYTKLEDLKKIPQSFIEFLINISNKNYKTNFNYNLPFNELNLTKQAKEILGFIYITWWCNEKQKKEYKNIIYSNKSRINEINEIENYDIDKIFKHKKENDINNKDKQETAMIDYKGQGLLKKLINKILNFFKHKL